jgi:hypothetical protein
MRSIKKPKYCPGQRRDTIFVRNVKFMAHYLFIYFYRCADNADSQVLAHEIEQNLSLCRFFLSPIFKLSFFKTFFFLLL